MSLLAGNGRNKANLLKLQAREAAQGSPASESLAILPAVPIERMDNDQSRTGEHGRHEADAGKMLRCMLVERKSYHMVAINSAY